jgi:hypothetical protein
MLDFQPKHLFAQGDCPGDYENGGWVALVNKETNHAALMTFSHCSCYGTWEAIDGDTPVWDGTIAEMFAMAQENRDPSLPSRVREEGDICDNELDILYKEIMEKRSEIAEFINPQGQVARWSKWMEN